ncbi:MAG: quinone-dependent dihydroorotate dehydrogenase [Arachnia sp.]
MTEPALGIRLARAAYEGALRPWLFRLDPEAIHDLMINALALSPPASPRRARDPVSIAGIRFGNKVGLAAGLDKDGRAAAAWAWLGFGFAELGTVTAQPQPGNPPPRLHRLPGSRAVINSMGFNNHGAAALAALLTRRGVRRGNLALGIPLGVSIGKTKRVDIEQATDDYLASVEVLRPVADYLVVNVSSPNTPGLRGLQDPARLSRLLSRIAQAAGEVPVFVKLSPDLDREARQAAVRVAEQSGAAAIIATNTTLSRDGLASADAGRPSLAGGLSGAPLTAHALGCVEHIAASTELPVIGVGGIMTPRDGQRMLDAGAQLLQLYTGFIYSGPALAWAITDLRR